jgi:branched-chain amino acid transport system substrate-binding protein
MRTFAIVIISATLIFTASAALAVDVHVGLASNFSEVSASNSNPYGDHFRKGVKLAVQDSAKELAAKHIHLVFDEFDYGTNQARVAESVRLAIASPVIASIGYNLSPQALIAAPLHHEARLPMFSSSSSANRLGTVGAYVHLGSFSNEYMGRTLAWVATKRLKATKAALIVAEDCAYCTDLANAFEAEFKKRNGTVLVRIGILESQKDFDKLATDPALRQADVIVVPNYELSSSRVISALLGAGISRPFIGGDGWGDTGEEFYKVLGGKQFTAFSLSHWQSGLTDSASVEFAKRYFQTYGQTPNDTAVLAYDSMKIMIRAILSAKAYTRDGVEEALDRIGTFQGITGHFKFVEPHSAPEKSILLIKVGATEFKIAERLNPNFSGKNP